MNEYGPIILWSVGVALALAGELWAVFNNQRGNTITEVFFRSPISLGAICSLLLWALWHFLVMQGHPSNYDYIFLGVGAVAGVFAWIYNRPKKKVIFRDKKD